MKKELLTYGLTSLVAAGIAVSYYNRPEITEKVAEKQIVKQEQVVQAKQESLYGKWIDHDVMDCLKAHVFEKYKNVADEPKVCYDDQGITTISTIGNLLKYVPPQEEIYSLSQAIYYNLRDQDPLMTTKKIGHKHINLIFNENGFTIKTTNKLEEFVYDANSEVKDKLLFAGDEYDDLNGDGKIDLSITHSDWQESILEDSSKTNKFFQKWKQEHNVDSAKSAYREMINRVKCVAYEQHNSICQKQ